MTDLSHPPFDNALAYACRHLATCDARKVDVEKFIGEAVEFCADSLAWTLRPHQLGTDVHTLYRSMLVEEMTRRVFEYMKGGGHE